MLNEWQIGRDAHNKKEIPIFFQKLWTEKRGENPLANEYKRNKFPFYGCLFFIICIALGFFAGFMELTKSFSEAVFIGFVVGLVIFFICGELPDFMTSRWHFNEYYNELSRLFNLFEIKPNAEVGKLSREEFAGLVAGSLRAKMRKVDKLEGFARMVDYSQFKQMHEAALFWELCDPNYGRYDPKKQ